ncbi:MAG TPA: hypothetical protein VIA06_18380 [Candidatus Dormibacteraeota bacterium]|jgi:hypothetical protein|nr:hypothetical protein [Candidatus Dormibacteraeota bacterium]
MDLLHLIHPGYVLAALLTLAVANAVYAVWPMRGRRFLRILITSAVGIVLGQVWALIGLPALQLGDANLLPGVLFALLLQPLAERLTPRALRLPR